MNTLHTAKSLVINAFSFGVRKQATGLIHPVDHILV